MSHFEYRRYYFSGVYFRGATKSGGPYFRVGLLSSGVRTITTINSRLLIHDTKLTNRNSRIVIHDFEFTNRNSRHKIHESIVAYFCTRHPILLSVRFPRSLSVHRYTMLFT